MLARVESIKILGVTFSRKFSVSHHVDELLDVSAQSLFALRTLRQHHLPTEALHAVFQAMGSLLPMIGDIWKHLCAILPP